MCIFHSPLGWSYLKLVLNFFAYANFPNFLSAFYLTFVSYFFFRSLNFLRNSSNGDCFFAHLPNARTCQKCKQIVVCSTAFRHHPEWLQHPLQRKERKIGPGQSKKL